MRIAIVSHDENARVTAERKLRDELYGGYECTCVDGEQRTAGVAKMTYRDRMLAMVANMLREQTAATGNDDRKHHEFFDLLQAYVLSDGAETLSKPIVAMTDIIAGSTWMDVVVMIRSGHEADETLWDAVREFGISCIDLPKSAVFQREFAEDIACRVTAMYEIKSEKSGGEEQWSGELQSQSTTKSSTSLNQTKAPRAKQRSRQRTSKACQIKKT